MILKLHDFHYNFLASLKKQTFEPYNREHVDYLATPAPTLQPQACCLYSNTSSYRLFKQSPAHPTTASTLATQQCQLLWITIEHLSVCLARLISHQNHQSDQINSAQFLLIYSFFILQILTIISWCQNSDQIYYYKLLLTACFSFFHTILHLILILTEFFVTDDMSNKNFLNDFDVRIAAAMQQALSNLDFWLQQQNATSAAEAHIRFK